MVRNGTKTLDLRKSKYMIDNPIVEGKTTGIECLICGDKIWSRHQHDFRRCKCGKCFVDGGRAYLRYGGDLDKIRQCEISIQ